MSSSKREEEGRERGGWGNAMEGKEGTTWDNTRLSQFIDISLFAHNSMPNCENRGTHKPPSPLEVHLPVHPVAQLKRSEADAIVLTAQVPFQSRLQWNCIESYDSIEAARKAKAGRELGRM